MCLITPNKRVKTARKDIISYKVLHQNLNAIFYNKKYELGVLYQTGIQPSTEWCVVGGEDIEWYDNNYEKILGLKKLKQLICLGEGFHSCSSLESAEKLKGNKYNYIITECIIPKGSKYYDSPFNYLVSNQIIINKVL
jgi:hypothetical protein